VLPAAKSQYPNYLSLQSVCNFLRVGAAAMAEIKSQLLCRLSYSGL